jgi:hypothetical protein
LIKAEVAQLKLALGDLGTERANVHVLVMEVFTRKNASASKNLRAFLDILI